MVSAIAPDETLAGVLRARAKRTPEDRLFLDVIGGLLIAAATVWARPTGWLSLLAAATCFVCYGLWAFAERRLSAMADAASEGPAWRVTRRVSAVVGMTAFITLLFALLGIALGRQIS